MAETVLTDPEIQVTPPGGAATDIAEYCTSISWPQEAETPEATAFGDRDRVYVGGGLRSSTITLEINEDYDPGAIDAILFPIVGEMAAWSWTPVDAPVSGSNPRRSANGILQSYSQGGAVGELATGSATIQCSGPITRAVV